MVTRKALAGLVAAFVVGGTLGAGLTVAVKDRADAQLQSAQAPQVAAPAQSGQATGQAGRQGLEARGTIPPMAPSAAAPASFADLAERLEPAVVNVRVTKVGPAVTSPFEGTPFEDFFRQAPGQRRQRVQGAGSGFVISPEGFIVTNNHVVEGAREVKVTFASGDEYPARVVGRDPKVDIALVKVDPKASLPSVALGDSDKLRIGDWVLAIGNPFGLEGTVTAGIVSAKGRVIGAGPYDDFLQTDAAINPGNSGGPLFNLRGEVVGINTAIVAGGQGVGFAIPINLAKTLLPQLREEGRVTRGWLGVVIQPVTPSLARSLKLKEARGALVADVLPDSPAARAGLKQGDVITHVQGQKIEESNALPRLVAGLKPGTKVELGVLRDGRTQTLTLPLGRMPDEDQAASAGGGEDDHAARVGVALADVPRALARQLNLPPGRGALVTAVEASSPADRAGVRPGDVIVEVNRHPVASPQAVVEAIRKAPASEPLLVRIAREGGQLYAALDPREPAESGKRAR